MHAYFASEVDRCFITVSADKTDLANLTDAIEAWSGGTWSGLTWSGAVMQLSGEDNLSLESVVALRG